jgi:hypothetical protein
MNRSSAAFISMSLLFCSSLAFSNQEVDNDLLQTIQQRIETEGHDDTLMYIWDKLDEENLTTPQRNALEQSQVKIYLHNDFEPLLERQKTLEAEFNAWNPEDRTAENYDDCILESTQIHNGFQKFTKLVDHEHLLAEESEREEAEKVSTFNQRIDNFRNQLMKERDELLINSGKNQAQNEEKQAVLTKAKQFNFPPIEVPTHFTTKVQAAINTGITDFNRKNSDVKLVTAQLKVKKSIEDSFNNELINSGEYKKTIEIIVKSQINAFCQQTFGEDCLVNE